MCPSLEAILRAVDLEIDWEALLAPLVDSAENFNSDFQPFTHITGPENYNSGLDLTPGSSTSAADEHTWSFPHNFHQHTTQTLGPPDVTSRESPLLSRPADLDKHETTKAASPYHSDSPPDLLTESPTHLVPNIFNPHEGIHKTESAAPERERSKSHVHPSQQPPNPPNLIPSSHGRPINAHSPILEGFSGASINDNNRMGPFMDGHQFAHPTILPTQCAQDHTPSPFLNPFEYYQPVAHQWKNLKQTPDKAYSDHSTKTSQIKLQIAQLAERYNRETARPFDNGGSPEKGGQNKLKRKKIQPTELIPASCRKHAAVISSQKSSHFEYRWIDFKPSTPDGRLVMEILRNFSLKDGKNVFDFAANYGQQSGRIIQGQCAQKMFCFESLNTENFHNFLRFFRTEAHPRLPYLNDDEKNTLATATMERFTLVGGDYDENSEYQRKIWQYKTHVLPDFEKCIHTCRDNVARKFDGEIAREKSNCFDQMNVLFPIYLLYVDLISALIPVQALDNEGELLKTQRKIAGHYFFELTQEALADDKKSETGNDGGNPRYDLIYEVAECFQKPHHSQKNDFGLIWRAIDYWLLNSREELRSKDCLGRNFKMFFNQLFRTWAGKDCSDEERVILRQKFHGGTLPVQMRRIAKTYKPNKKEKKMKEKGQVVSKKGKLFINDKNNKESLSSSTRKINK